MAHPSGPNDYGGKWNTHYFCVKCDHEVTYSQKRYSHGCCPYCGHIFVGFVMDTVTRSMRWVSIERKWWQVWRIFKGTLVEKGSWIQNHQAMTGARKQPLCDVTVFQGPNGVFSVSQDRDLWSVEKTPDARDNSLPGKESLPPGRTSFKTRFPIAPSDEHAGSFDRRDKAIKAAIKWSGLWPDLDTHPTHPVPNRRAAIAHTKAKS